MTDFLNRIISKLSWITDDLLWVLHKPDTEKDGLSKGRITIGITTYKDRFDNCLKPLLAKIAIQFPDCQVVVTANGHVNSAEQLTYIAEVEKYCRKFRNIELITFTDPRGLSFLWNLIIRKSASSHTLMLNDDLNIKSKFRSFIAGSGISDSVIASINGSWSHFIISKTVVSKVGWFDENLSEIGGEDDDYLARLGMHGIRMDNFITNTIARKGIRGRNSPQINSFGKDMLKEEGGYSTLNTRYINNKWETSDRYFDGAVEVPGRNIRYWKLKESKQEEVNPAQ